MFVYTIMENDHHCLINTAQVDLIEDYGPREDLITVYIHDRKEPIHIKENFDSFWDMITNPQEIVVSTGPDKSPLSVEATIYQGYQGY